MLLFCARSVSRVLCPYCNCAVVHIVSFSPLYLRIALDEDPGGKHLMRVCVTHSAAQGTESQMLIVPVRKISAMGGQGHKVGSDVALF